MKAAEAMPMETAYLS